MRETFFSEFSVFPKLAETAFRYNKSLLYSNRPSSYARLIATPIFAIAASNRSQFTGISIS